MSVRRLRESGMALIAVLWVVAAMSLMIAALLHLVRSEARQAILANAQVRATAGGEAAIALVLQRMASSAEDRPQSVTTVDVSFDNVPMRVQVMPINGLIDLNNASQDLLALLLGGGGLPESQAQQGANALIDFRKSTDAGGRPIGFSAPEDLLRVPGFDFDLYAKVAPLVTADVPVGGAGKVNPLAAPEGVLAALAGGRKDVAQAVLRSRSLDASSVDLSALDSRHLAIAPTSIYVLRAAVASGADGFFHISRTVVLSTSAGRGLPWQTLRAEQWFEQSAK